MGLGIQLFWDAYAFLEVRIHTHNTNHVVGRLWEIIFVNIVYFSSQVI